VNKIDMHITSFYMNLLNDISIGKTAPKEKLLDPSVDILRILYDEFLETVKNYAVFYSMKDCKSDKMNLDDEDLTDDIDRNVRKAISLSIKEATTYLMFYYSDHFEELVNGIIKTPMETVVDDFLEKTAVSFEIFKFYIRYLVERHFGCITVTKEVELWDKYPWLEKLECNKGYMCFNDKARYALRKVIETYVEMVSSPDGTCSLIDHYFNDYESLGVGESFVKEFAFSRESIKAIKQYQFNLMLADVYRNLKGSVLIAEQDSDDESIKPCDFLEILENYIEYRDTVILNSRKFRTELYNQFYLISTGGFSIETPNGEFENAEDCHIIRPLNPLYFLD